MAFCAGSLSSIVIISCLARVFSLSWMSPSGSVWSDPFAEEVDVDVLPASIEAAVSLLDDAPAFDAAAVPLLKSEATVSLVDAVEVAVPEVDEYGSVSDSKETVMAFAPLRSCRI